jgi:hypothetical protein
MERPAVEVVNIFRAHGPAWRQTVHLVSCKPGFFLPVRVLLRLFRRRFLEELKQARRAGQLQFFGEYTGLTQARDFARWLASLRQCEWVVYAKWPFAGPAAVLAYLSRYMHRVAISNQRLVALDEHGGTFGWKDYRTRGRTRRKTINADRSMVYEFCLTGSKRWSFANHAQNLTVR